MKNILKGILPSTATRDQVRVLINVYCLIIISGFLLLSLPFCQKVPVKILDNFFIAASAVSTTGLTSVSVSDSYNFLGQFVILLLTQIGGIHYMSFGSLIMLAGRKKFNKFHEELVRSDFGLPDEFDILSFLRSVVFFSFGVEFIGAIGLYFVFLNHGTENPLWNAVFHSVSAFCTAGFSLFNSSFENYANNGWLNGIIIALSILGAMGFIVVLDFWLRIRGKRKDVTLTTKIIVWFTLGVIALGTILLLLTNKFSGAAEWSDRFWQALFQSMSAMTTVGFDTIPIGQLSHGTLYLLTILMLIGASPAGTGGGIKSTTIVAVLTQMYWTLRGKTNVTFMGYQIPNYRLRLASASFTFYIIILTIGIYFLNLVDDHTIFEGIFEATSALGTVGLSMGITSTLSSLGKIVIILLMMLGRIGPLTIGLALFYDKDKIDNIGWQEDVVL